MDSIVTARFHPGQIVQHSRDGYRGVIVDVDARYDNAQAPQGQLPDEARGQPQPWYHVLVDGADYATYAAESDLRPDKQDKQVQHPWLANFFHGYHTGAKRYLDRYPRM